MRNVPLAAVAARHPGPTPRPGPDTQAQPAPPARPSPAPTSPDRPRELVEQLDRGVPADAGVGDAAPADHVGADLLASLGEEALDHDARHRSAARDLTGEVGDDA